MGKAEQIAGYLGISDDRYSYGMNHSGELISLEIFEPEYEYSDSFHSSHLMQFVTSFKNLESLEINLDDFTIEDVNGISDLKNLKTLHIECDTQIRNLYFLLQMKNLEHLYIHSSQITDLKNIGQNSRLIHLSLGSGRLKDLSPLEELANLEHLGIFDHQIQDISVVTYLKKLRSVHFQHNIIEDISAFSESSAIRHLNVSFNKIKDLDAIKENTEMAYLNFSNNGVQDISVLKNFRNLQDLSFANNRVEDISALENTEALQQLHIPGNTIKKILPLKNHRNLRILNAANNPLEDIGETGFASQFTYLNLENTGIKDISFLDNQHTVNHLILDYNSIENFSPLEGKTALKEISLRDNHITESFPVHYFSNLDMVDLSGNPFGNEKFHRYRALDGNNKEIQSLTWLMKLNADYYFRKGLMDEALAYFYYNHGNAQTDVEIFYIYLHKLLNIPAAETVYVKYYFSKISNFLRWNNNHMLASREEYAKMRRKLSEVKEPESSSMLGILDPIEKGKKLFSNFNFYDFQFYEEAVSNPYVSDELLFVKGSMLVTRDNLMTNLYDLKLLKKLNSPYYFPLLHAIEKVLKMNFAYTEEERKKHDHYRSLIQNLEKSNIPESKAAFSKSYFDRHYQYVHYNHPEISEEKKNNGKGSGTVLFIISVITIFAAFMFLKSCLNLFST